MGNSFSYQPFLVVFLAAFVACSSDSSNSADTSPTKTSSNTPAAKAVSGVKVTAFLRGAASDEPAAKAFEQGMQLAATSKSPPVVEVNVLNRSDGIPGSSDLKSVLEGRTPLVVYWQTSDLEPAVPALKEAPVVAVSVWNVTDSIPRLGSNVYGFGYSTEKTFAGFAKFAGKNLKSYRFGVISASSAPFESQSKEFVEETKSQGNTVVFEENAATSGTDFSSLISRATKENCDTIFAVLPGDSLVTLIKAARAGAYKGKILVGDSFYGSELAQLGKDAEGIFLTQAWSDDATFKTNYVAKFGSEPDGVMLGAAALGFDLIKCLEIAGEHPDAEAIKYAWLSQACEGLTGRTQFSGERMAQRSKRVLTIKDGKFEAVG